MLFTVLLAASLLETVLGGEPIPNDLKKKLKGAHSFQDFASMAQVGYMAQPKIKLKGASAISLPSTKKSNSINELPKNDMEILSTIRQGNDTCILQSICIPVPVDVSSPDILVFPRCYQVSQCVGSCCDSAESCHPTAKEYVHRPVLEMIYSGNNKFILNQTLNITMEQHLACSCRDCVAEGIGSCSSGRVLSASCTCECKNQADKKLCAAHWKWNEEECACRCPTRFCPPHEILNQAACVCEKLGRKRHRPDLNGNFMTDTSKLPKIQLRDRKTQSGRKGSS